MWQDVKSELRDACTSQPLPLGKKYLFSWAAHSKLSEATHPGMGVMFLSINFNLTLKEEQFLESFCCIVEYAKKMF